MDRNIYITKPYKACDVVLLNKADHNKKVSDISNDSEKYITDITEISKFSF